MQVARVQVKEKEIAELVRTAEVLVSLARKIAEMYEESYRLGKLAEKYPGDSWERAVLSEAANILRFTANDVANILTNIRRQLHKQTPCR